MSLEMSPEDTAGRFRSLFPGAVTRTQWAPLDEAAVGTTDDLQEAFRKFRDLPRMPYVVSPAMHYAIEAAQREAMANREKILRERGSGMWKVRVRGLYVKDMTFERDGALEEPTLPESLQEFAAIVQRAERLFRAEHPGIRGTTLGYVLEGWPEYAEPVARAVKGIVTPNLIQPVA